MQHKATQELLNWVDTLLAQEKMYALDMHENMASKGIKPRLNWNKKLPCENFKYWHKGLPIVNMRKNSNRNSPLCIGIEYRLKGGVSDIHSLVEACSGEPDSGGLTNYIIKNVCCCNRCGNNSRDCKKWVEFAGVRRKLAQCQFFVSNSKAPKARVNLTDDDMHWLKRLVDIRMKQIALFKEI